MSDLKWDGTNPVMWARCSRHGRYNAQDGACPDCVRIAEEKGEDADTVADGPPSESEEE